MGDEEVKGEVQEMNKSFGFDFKVEPTNGKEDKDTKPNVEDEDIKSDAEDEGIAELENTEDPEEDPKPEDKDPDNKETPPIDEDPPVDETEEPPKEDEKDNIIAELRKKLGEKEDKEKEEEPSTSKEEEPPSFEVQDFIGEDGDLEDLIQDPEKLNTVFNNIYQRAVTDTRKVVTEGVLRAIPDIVRTSVDMIDKLKAMNTKFYNDNKDLEPFKKVVAAVFEEVATEHPGKDMMDILPMVADKSRERLELHNKAIKSDTKRAPRLPSRKRRVTIPEDKPNTNPLLNELEEMNKTLRR